MCRMDWGFLLHGSANLGYFQIMKNMSIEVARGLTIGPSSHRVAIARYEDRGRAEILLNRYNNRDELLKAIAQLRRANSGANAPDQGLDTLFRSVFPTDNRNGNRPDTTYPNIAIVFVSGSPRNLDAIRDKAATLKTAGVTIVAVDVEGRASREILEAIASSPNYVLRGSNYYRLPALLDNVIPAACTPEPRGEVNSFCCS